MGTAHINRLTRRRLIPVGLGSALSLTAARKRQRPTSVVAAEPLIFTGWSFQPDFVASSVSDYIELFNDDVSYQLIPDYPQYHSIMEARLIGGDNPDVMYSEEWYLSRWLKAGWIQDLEGLPDVERHKEAMNPVNLRNLISDEGNLVALPYYTSCMIFAYHEEMLNQAGLLPPTSWDELVEQCRQLKSNGISEYPYVGYWRNAGPSFNWQFYADNYSEGELLFDEEHNPTFQDSQVTRRILERYRLMYEEELVPPDALTAVAPTTFTSGGHAFFTGHWYIMRNINTPGLSKVAGKVKLALYPGDPGDTFIWTAAYVMNAQTADRDRAWDFMRFMGGQASDGEWYIPKRFVMQFGLGTPYEAVMDDPEVKSALSQWLNLDVLNQQQREKAKTRDVDRALWFPEWNLHMITQVQDFIQGAGSADDVVRNLYDKAGELKQRYGSL